MRYPNKTVPVRLGLYTQKIVNPVFKTRGLMEGRIITHWSQIVGERFSAFSLPEKITFPKGKKNEGMLHLTVTSAGSLLLQSVHDLVLDKINTFFGYKALSKIYMTHGFIPSKLSFTKVFSPPSPEIREWVEGQIQHIEDQELKDCLKNFGTSLVSTLK